MPRIGFKNNRIKAIIYHTSNDPNLDNPTVYKLDDGKHICLMPRAPRTNYRKKEKLKKLKLKSKYIFQNNVFSQNPTFMPSQEKKAEFSSVKPEEMDCTNAVKSLDQKNESNVDNAFMKISSLKEKEKFSAFFQFDEDQFNSDTYFNNSDFDE